MMQMQKDAAYIAEVIPPNLQKLIEGLREAFLVPAANIGAKGDLEHRRGYHRSRRFLLSSAYAGNRFYSVSEPGNDGGSPDWICAIDISLPEPELMAMCRRLDAAIRAGRLEKIAEWYGNINGDQRVDGYDNIRNRLASSDSSHLWHAHLSFIRGRANEDHADVLAVLTGKDSDMEPDTNVPVPKNKPYPGYLGDRDSIPAGELWHAIYYHVGGIENALKDLNETLARLSAAVTKSAQQPAAPATAIAILNDLSARLRAAATAGK